MEDCKHILIVDDDQRVLFVLSRALRSLENGCSIETAESAREALEKARSTPYDIVITDILMPGMDGRELTEEIRDLHPEAAVIWITAHGAYRFRSDVERLDVCQCLEKPIQIAELRQAVVDAAKRAGG